MVSSETGWFERREMGAGNRESETIRLEE